MCSDESKSPDEDINESSSRNANNTYAQPLVALLLVAIIFNTAATVAAVVAADAATLMGMAEAGAER